MRNTTPSTGSDTTDQSSTDSEQEDANNLNTKGLKLTLRLNHTATDHNVKQIEREHTDAVEGQHYRMESRGQIPTTSSAAIENSVHRDYNQLPPKAPNLITLPSIDTLGGPGFHRLPPITSMLPNPAPPPNHQKPFRTEARKSKKQRAWVSGTCALCGPVTTPVFRRPKVATPSDKLVPDRICNACSMFIRRKAKTKGTEDKKKENEKDETKQS